MLHERRFKWACYKLWNPMCPLLDLQLPKARAASCTKRLKAQCDVVESEVCLPHWAFCRRDDRRISAAILGWTKQPEGQDLLLFIGQGARRHLKWHCAVRALKFWTLCAHEGRRTLGPLEDPAILRSAIPHKCNHGRGTRLWKHREHSGMRCFNLR